MDILKKIMPKVFVNTSSILLIYGATVIAAHVPVIGEHYLMLGIVGTAFGFDKVKGLVSKLPGVRGK